MTPDSNSSRSAVRTAANVLFYAPVGWAIRMMGKLDRSEDARLGRSRFEMPLEQARFIGEKVMRSGRENLAQTKSSAQDALARSASRELEQDSRGHDQVQRQN